MRNKFFFGAVGFFLVCLFVLFAFGVARAVVPAPVRQDVAVVDKSVTVGVENAVAVVDVAAPVAVAVNRAVVADEVSVADGVGVVVEVEHQVA